MEEKATGRARSTRRERIVGNIIGSALFLAVTVATIEGFFRVLPEIV